MANIKPLDAIVAKYVRNASVAGESYREGVQSPRVPWQAATTAAAASWQAGVQAAITRGAFQAGVRATPDSHWQARAATLGADRYPSGVAAGAQRYAERFQPFAEVIRATQLPPRGPRGDARNLERVAVIARALHQRRVGRQGG